MPPMIPLRFLAGFRLCLIVLAIAPLARASPRLDEELSHILVGHSFTIRNFYRGTHLQYGSDGELLEKAEPGYWSRDGMVEFSSIKISADNRLIMQGKRTCIFLDQHDGEFNNVTTGDHLEIEVQLKPDQVSSQAIIPLLQRILLNSRDRLPDLVPPYWKNCLSRKVDRRDKHSPWECEVADKQEVPDFTAHKVSWDLPSPDTSLHDGMRHYLIRHRVAYLSEPGIKDPSLYAASDPVFQWSQVRTQISDMTLVLGFTVGKDGRAQNIFIVSPIGMGIDDDAVQTLTKWRFKPGMLGDKPRAVHARVNFDIASTHFGQTQ